MKLRPGATPFTSEDMAKFRGEPVPAFSDVTIDVHCDDQSTRGGMHNGRDVKVVTFHRHEGRWIVLRHERIATRDAHDRAREEYVTRTGENFDDAEYIKHMLAAVGEGYDVPEQTDRRDALGLPARYDDKFAHTTYRLPCSLCGLDFQRRADAVDPVLDRLWAAGIERISLVQLSAMVGP